jgi:hypothetical protein
MFHPIASIAQGERRGKGMRTENERCNALEHVPTCSTWPPPWLAPSTPPVAAAPKLAEPLPDPDALDSSAVAPELPVDLLAELQREVDSLMDIAWSNVWAERLRTARYADLDAVRRSVRLMLDLAAARHRAGDAAEFQAWRRFIIRHVCGEQWDDAASRLPVRAEDFEIVA